ncbi:hypothetical protein [Planococcus salinarum]|uniref:hypothetical protein n=1 Tax=Planococcus salinarum TaxID=622695 RepID=UPI0021B151D4|nr:hypothetical protein [Planococcus salinarum]
MAAFAATASSASTSVSDALSNVGIKDTGGTSGLFDDWQNVIYLVIGIGGFRGVLWLVIGAMLLTGSGGNPQKRGTGMAALFSAVVGLFVVYKAYDIASWATGVGG